MSSSILDVGQRCSAPSCHTIDFLPIQCPTCLQSFCSTHIHSTLHACFGGNTSQSHEPRQYGESSRMAKCRLEGCENNSMEAVGRTENMELPGEVIGREIKCEGCGEAYCFEHRSQQSHSCSGPTKFQADQQAKLDRKAVAAAAIAAAFPSRVVKEIPKPPPGKTAAGLNAASKLGLPTNTTATSSSSSSSGATPVPPPLPTPTTLPKSKSDKLQALSLMKLKSRATPITPAGAKLSTSDRWFFAWSLDERGVGLVGGGKGLRKEEAVFTSSSSSVGRLVDVLAAKAKIPNKPSATDLSQNLFLVLLGEGAEPAQVLEGKAVVREVIPAGRVVVLVRGLGWQGGSA